jgi:hypothetical protein
MVGSATVTHIRPLWCSDCRRELAPGEPVWWKPHLRQMRVVPTRINSGLMANGQTPIIGSGDGPVCADCTRDERDLPNRWFPPRPCVWCGRDVHLSRRSESGPRRRTYAYCHEYCQWAYYNRRRSEALAADRQRTCLTCEATFTPPRRDTRYCSGACKQLAYRQRAAGAR